METVSTVGTPNNTLSVGCSVSSHFTQSRLSGHVKWPHENTLSHDTLLRWCCPGGCSSCGGKHCHSRFSGEVGRGGCCLFGGARQVNQTKVFCEHTGQTNCLLLAAASVFPPTPSKQLRATALRHCHCCPHSSSASLLCELPHQVQGGSGVG